MYRCVYIYIYIHIICYNITSHNILYYDTAQYNTTQHTITKQHTLLHDITLGYIWYTVYCNVILCCIILYYIILKGSPGEARGAGEDAGVEAAAALARERAAPGRLSASKPIT